MRENTILGIFSRLLWELRKKQPGLNGASGNSAPPTDDRVIDHSKKGLKLVGGRVITWKVAVLKIKNKELNLSGDIAPRLLKKLKELNVGQAIWLLLQ